MMNNKMKLIGTTFIAFICTLIKDIEKSKINKFW
jgi:hypothetical protein